jgi:hypothetical protein
MSPTPTRTAVDYKVVDGRDVFLTITFGNGQLGASTVIGANAIVGDVNNWRVGGGAALRGSNINIHSVLTDVNASTNRLNADYALSGGDHAQTVSLESTVAEEGDSDRYNVVVNFV